jgi:hypothetical protein
VTPNQNETMDSRLLFPEKYLKSDDFAGREVTFTIREAKSEMLHKPKGEEEAIVLYFEELHAKALATGRPQNQKRIALGKTLQRDLESVLGSSMTEDWKGRRVTFFRGPALAGGKQCIRAKAAAPLASAPTTTTPTDTTTPKES